MENLLGISTAAIVIGCIVGFIVLCVIMHYINRYFRVNYGMNLIGGGFLMLLAEGAIGGGIFLAAKSENKILGFVLIGLGLFITIITLVYDCKRCGGMGILAIICQTFFSVTALYLILDLLFNHGRGMTTDYRERRIIREKRREKGFDDYNNFY